MAQLAAKKYAQALYEIYLDECSQGDKDNSNGESLYKEAQVLLDLINNEKGFKEILLHPRVTAEQKAEIVHKSFKGLSGVMIGFLDVVIRKNREDELLQMLTIFIELAENHKGIINAHVYTASPLTDEQIEKIKKNLSGKTNKTVNLDIKEDKSLIGGLCIKAGGFIYDTSVKKQLSDMRFSLLS